MIWGGWGELDSSLGFVALPGSLEALGLMTENQQEKGGRDQKFMPSHNPSSDSEGNQGPDRGREPFNSHSEWVTQMNPERRSSGPQP
jgi:hypothetical protein